MRATRALGKCRTRQAVRLLVARLADGHPTVELMATGTLAELGTNAPEVLAAALHDDSWQVRVAAAEALVRAGWQPANVAERAALAVARGRYGEAAEMGTVALDPLLWHLRYGHRLLREQVVSALGKIGDSRAVGALLENLDNTDYSLQEEAARALGRIGDQKAIEPLLRMIARRDVYHGGRMAAAEALVRIGDVRVVPWLLELAMDQEEALSAVVELKRIVTDRASEVRPDDLEAVAVMPNALQIEHDWADDDGNGVKYRYAIACSDLRKLARNELSRRRLDDT